MQCTVARTVMSRHHLVTTDLGQSVYLDRPPVSCGVLGAGLEAGTAAAGAGLGWAVSQVSVIEPRRV